MTEIRIERDIQSEVVGEAIFQIESKRGLVFLLEIEWCWLCKVVCFLNTVRQQIEMKRWVDIPDTGDVTHPGNGRDDADRSFFARNHHPFVSLLLAGDVTAEVYSPNIFTVLR